MFSVFGKLSLTPAQRSSNATDPVCWMLHRILVAPSAFFTVGIRASGVTSVVAMPSTLESIAFWIRTACLVASGSEEYFRVEPVSLAAWLAPDLIRSQNV